MLRYGRFAEEFEQGCEEATVADAVSYVRELRKAYGTGRAMQPIGRERSRDAEDARWVLLAELECERAAYEGLPFESVEWEPMRIDREYHDWSVFPERLTITFDNRLSLETLIRELRGAWPRFRREGWVRRSRPLDRRTVDLLRFVCLEAPTDSKWRDRCAAWNETRGDEWRFPDVRAFQSAFRRAEKALTGKPRGLAWFYDSGFRQAVSPEPHRVLADIGHELDQVKQQRGDWGDRPMPPQLAAVYEWQLDGIRKRLDALNNPKRPEPRRYRVFGLVGRWTTSEKGVTSQGGSSHEGDAAKEDR